MKTNITTYKISAYHKFNCNLIEIELNGKTSHETYIRDSLLDYFNEYLRLAI